MKLKGWQVIVFLGFALIALGASAASPTADDIYQAARAGHLAEAQRMVDQVVAEHPKSAKAHYVAAQVYAKEGQFAIARNELQTAEQLKPGLPFAKPQSVTALKALLAAPPAPGAAPAQQRVRHGSFPFGPLVIGLLAIGVVIVVIKAMAARTSNQVYYAGGNQNYPPSGGYPNGGYPNGGYPPGGYPPGGYPSSGGGLGSGIVGGLATGAAVGAGMVAGEALAHHFLDGDNTQAAQAATNAVQPAQFVQNDDMGGSDFGLTDTGSWDDSGDTFADSSGDDDWS